MIKKLINKWILNYLRKNGNQIKVDGICINCMSTNFNEWVYSIGYYLYKDKEILK